MRRRLALLGGTTDGGDIRTALSHLVRPWRLVRGPEIEAYERAFAAAAGARHAIAFNAGRVGLLGILRGLGVGAGDEVLLQAPTHIVVANAITHAGAEPVYVDCDPRSWNIDLEDAERRVTPRTRVLVLQHTFGVPADLDAARAFCDRHGLLLVEDCVHALGATYRGHPVGSFGRAAFFSTEETKVISSTMGGMAVTDDDDLAASLRAFQAACAWPSRWLVARYLIKLLAYHALTQPTVHTAARALYERAGQRQPLPTPVDDEELAGVWPADIELRLSAGQAAVARRQLRRLGENLRHRRALAARYAQLLTAAGLPVAAVPDGTEPTWVRYPTEVPDRPAAIAGTARDVVLGLWFTSVLEEARRPEDGRYPAGSCPAAEHAAEHLVNLPTHLRVRPDDADRMTAALVASQDGRR